MGGFLRSRGHGHLGLKEVFDVVQRERRHPLRMRLPEAHLQRHGLLLRQPHLLNKKTERLRTNGMVDKSLGELPAWRIQSLREFAFQKSVGSSPILDGRSGAVSAAAPRTTRVRNSNLVVKSLGL